MARMSHKWQNTNTRWGERGDEYSWQDGSPQDDYRWLKKIIVAGIVFAIVYCAHISETRLGRAVDDAVQYTLATQTDFAYLAEQITTRVPGVFDLSMLKKVQAVITRPADPLLYMSKPVTGKVLAPFGRHSRYLNRRLCTKALILRLN
jgi:hypothetical protein